MIVNPVLQPRIIEDYDLLFNGGILLPVTIDKDAGDSVDFDTSPLLIRFSLVSKQSPMDPDEKTSPEEITVFVSQLLSITRRTREVMPVTPEQQQAIKSFIHKLHPTKQ